MNSLIHSMLLRPLLGLGLACASSVVAADSGAEFFESKIRPLLIEHCYEGHSGEKTKGGLSMDTRAGGQKGGHSGAVIVSGKPDESSLIKAVRYQDKDLAMPPQKHGGKLSDPKIALLTEWVRQGAPDPRETLAKVGGKKADEAKNWWSFQALPTPEAKPTPTETQRSEAFLASYPADNADE